MKIRGIRQDLLALLLQMGRENHPNEFAAVIREQEGIMEELNLLPGTIGREDSASLFYDMMPLDTHVAGSAHSHPNGVIIPSDADLSFFPRTGRYHLIIGYPYRKNDWRCFTADGQACNLEVIP
ncbi:MAG: Mov34/MPN/PAD-1 family protein [Methanoregula sp.]|nr:Mov34/MPN/PAD-1 family protein [Methanoregula sp.]